jgi:hypothetical protein
MSIPHDGVNAALRLTRALIRREAGIVLPVVLLFAIGAAAVAAHEVQNTGDVAMSSLVDRLLRRFDLTALAVMVFAVILRVAIRTEEDHRAGWIGPVTLSGIPRWSYAPAVTISALILPVSAFTVATVSFAVSVMILSGTAELIRVLPATLGSGILLLVMHAVCATAFGTAFRNVSATIGVAAMLTLAPLFLMFRHFSEGRDVPLWVIGLAYAAPLSAPPSDTGSVVRVVLYIALAGSLAALVSHRVAGRQA